MELFIVFIVTAIGFFGMGYSCGNLKQDLEPVSSYNPVLDTAFSFLVLCHLQPEKVDQDELEAFLIENNALEDY